MVVTSLGYEGSHVRLCAGIVSYNPDIQRLRQNLEAICSQIDKIFVIDNGSLNVDAIQALIRGYTNVEFSCLHKNFGIAFALNRLMEAAQKNSIQYMLLLDQDSVAGEDMVMKLAQYCSPSVGIVSPVILDRNKNFATKDTSINSVVEVSAAARKGVITSGALTSVDAWRLVGGFDETLFIDYVDYDFNERLLLNRFKILKITDAVLIHEVGHATTTWLWTPRRESDGKWRIERFYSFGHSPMRCYFKARNRIIYTKKYARFVWNRFEGIYQIPVQIILVVLFEHQRKEKISMFIHGIIDGCHTKVKKYKRIEL